LFRSYPAPAGSCLAGISDAPIWAAARSSSAAPPFFEKFDFDVTVESESGEDEIISRVFLDGGIANNNPLLLAIEEARTLWPNDRIVAVSLGTGNAPMEKARLPSGAKKVAGAVGVELQVLIDSFTAIADVATSSTFPRRLLDDLPYLKYIRLEPILGQSFQLDETRDEKLSLMLYIALRQGLEALPKLQSLLLDEYNTNSS